MWDGLVSSFARHYVSAADEHECESLLVSPCPPPEMVLKHVAWLKNLASRSRVGERTQALTTFAAEVDLVAESLPRWPRAQSAATRRSVMDPAIVKAVESYDFTTGLLILGNTGTGKTVGLVHLLLTAWERAFRQQKRCMRSMLVKAVELGACRRCHPLGEGEPPLLVDATEVGLLLLDDLGQDDKRDNTVFDLLDERYDAGRPTVVTSGFSRQELQERYGQALIRRIVETNGEGKIVNLMRQLKVAK